MSSSIVCDIIVILLCATVLSISGAVWYITNNLFYKTLALVLLIVLSVAAVLWLVVIVAALVVSCLIRVGLSESIRIGVDISKQFELKFLSSDFDSWEVEKVAIERRIAKEFCSQVFLIDILNLQQDIERVSRFLFFWKEVWLRINTIVSAMSEVKWNENQLTVDRYLQVIEALRQLDRTLRDADYCDHRFEFLSQALVRRRHCTELERLKNKVIDTKDATKRSQISSLITSSVHCFELKFRQQFQSH